MTSVKKYFKNDRYRNVEGILKVVKDGLCHRCGACIGFCPVGTFGIDKKGFPKQVSDCIDCNICVQSCSGIEVDYNGIGKRLYDGKYFYGTLMGPVQKAFVGHATDPEIRNKGASGGVVTQLLDHMIATGKIEGAIVVVEDPGNPAVSKGIIARNREDLLLSQQSRYTTSPHLHVLNEIQDKEGPFALVGLPCQIHSLRKRQAIDPRWKSRIPFVIGLLCHYNLPMESLNEAALLIAPKGTHLLHSNFRKKDEQGWPTNTLEMAFSDGSKWRAPYGPAQVFNVVSRLSKLGRCLQCLDAAAEFADISVGDPWIRSSDGSWKYEEPEGLSAFLVRTSTGEGMVKDAVAAGKIVIREIPKEEIEIGQSQWMYEKKNRTPFRIKVRKAFGLKTPLYTMEFGKVSWSLVLDEIQFWFARLIPMFGIIRRPLFRIGFSRIGVYIVGRRVIKRKAKFAKRNAKS